MQQTKIAEGVHFRDIDFNACIECGEPCIFKGALNTSALVKLGRESNEKAMAHLCRYKNEQALLYYLAGPQAKTRFFYNEELSGFNYTTALASLNDVFAAINLENQQERGGSVYVGSTEVDEYFPGLLDQDKLRISFESSVRHPVFTGIWIGNKTTAATHYDMSNNVAACLVGRRRFTLFPPEQISNLYPGPLEPTPGGQVVSMVDINEPDLVKYPKFVDALATAQIAELDSGDVLVYPAMWWHQVEALEEFNVLINYWWNTVAGYVDDPMNTLLHGLLSLRGRPAHERRAWRHVFDYYVFADSEQPRSHLPERSWGELGEFDAGTARRLRSKLLKKLNR